MQIWNLIVRFFQGGGDFMYPIAIVLVFGLAIAIERWVYLAATAARNRGLWNEIVPLLSQGNFRGVSQLTSKSSSAIGHILNYGLARIQSARRRDDIEKAMEESLMEVVPRLEKRTHYLATFANLATLLGLLGTVMGLIRAFAAVATVNSQLAGIPQHGNVLGNPKAKVTITEYGDLVCPVCRDFALGTESQLIANEVRQGKVKIVYKALETASQTANNSMFVPSQTAALSAGQQKLGWYYIELFYHEQGDETTSYVTDSYLDGLAQQVPGLNYSQWSSDRQSSTLASQVNADQQAAANAGYNSTPTLLIQGPKGQAQPIVGNPTSYSQLQSAINSVS